MEGRVAHQCACGAIRLAANTKHKKATWIYNPRRMGSLPNAGTW